MFCVNCGKPIPDASRFCPYCGTLVPNLADRPAYEEVLKRVPAQKGEKYILFSALPKMIVRNLGLSMMEKKACMSLT